MPMSEYYGKYGIRSLDCRNACQNSKQHRSRLIALPNFPSLNFSRESLVMNFKKSFLKINAAN